MSQEDNLNIQEQGTPDTESAQSEAPPLNRAQRRAQARGKAAPSGPAAPGGASSARSGPSSRSGGHAGPVRFPRTGHK